MNKEQWYKVWQRMHSAPKDGTDVLLLCKAKGAYVGSWKKEVNMWVPKYLSVDECENCGNEIPVPAYWCELPKICHM